MGFQSDEICTYWAINYHTDLMQHSDHSRVQVGETAHV